MKTYKVTIDNEGTERWYNSNTWWKFGDLHRDDDQPAIICPDGGKLWFKNGKIHRDNDKPAVICPDGGNFWYKDGKFHRDNDKPARIYLNGKKEWWVDGKFIKRYIPQNIYMNKSFENSIISINGESYKLVKV